MKIWAKNFHDRYKFMCIPIELLLFLTCGSLLTWVGWLISKTTGSVCHMQLRSNTMFEHFQAPIKISTKSFLSCFDSSIVFFHEQIPLACEMKLHKNDWLKLICATAIVVLLIWFARWISILYKKHRIHFFEPEDERQTMHIFQFNRGNLNSTSSPREQTAS